MPPNPPNPISHIGRALSSSRPPCQCMEFSTQVPHDMPHPSTVQGLATLNPRCPGAQGKAVSPAWLGPASALPGLQKELGNELCIFEHTTVLLSARAIHRHQDHPIRTSAAQVMTQNVSVMSARVSLNVKEGQQAGHCEPARHEHIPGKPLMWATPWSPISLCMVGGGWEGRGV